LHVVEDRRRAWGGISVFVAQKNSGEWPHRRLRAQRNEIFPCLHYGTGERADLWPRIFIARNASQTRLAPLLLAEGDCLDSLP
jgi:hypothetical protein